MKKMYIVALFLLVTLGVRSQITIKPAVGLNFTGWSGNPVGGEVKSRAGWQIGGSIMFGQKFYIEPGIFYVGKSTKVEGDTSFEATINGIRIPVAIGLKLLGSDSSMFRLRVFGGGAAFFVTNVKDIEKDELEKANFGVFAGAGLDFWKLFLDASYEWSLTNVQKDIQEVDLGKSRSVFISAGIRITL